MGGGGGGGGKLLAVCAKYSILYHDVMTTMQFHIAWLCRCWFQIKIATMQAQVPGLCSKYSIIYNDVINDIVWLSSNK